MEKTKVIRIASGALTLDDTRWRDSICPAVVQVLSEGGLVILPTETSYMLGGDATRFDTMQRLRVMKDRPGTMDISVMFSSIGKAMCWTVWSDTARMLGRKYLPGPLTMVLPLRSGVTQFASHGGFLGIRIPRHPFLQDVLRQVDFPVTATSANPHGGPEPYDTRRCVTGADLVWDSGCLKPNPPTTIVKIANDTLEILRRGSIDIDSDIT